MSDCSDSSTNPIAVLPVDEDGQSRAVEPGGGTVADFESSVRTGGGVVAELDGKTRGLVWLSYTRTTELAEVLTAYPDINWVQLPWAGVDAFSEVMRDYTAVGRVWTSAKGAYAEPVAEHALALSLALLRVIPERVMSRSWSLVPAGISLHGLEVVIVGAGGIAKALVRLLEPFDVRITVVRRTANPLLGADSVVLSKVLGDVLHNADLVVLAAALTPETYRLFGSQQFLLMKPSSYLVNVARGQLVDSDALVDALAAGQIAGAGIDVTDPEPLPDAHPLWEEPSCIITPHSSNTPAMKTPLLQERIVQNVQAFLRGGEFIGVVDPEIGY